MSFLYSLRRGNVNKRTAAESVLSGELLAERCGTDDLMPNIPILRFPPIRVDPKVLGLNVLVYHSQPGGSCTTRRSPPIRWWLQRGGDDTVMVLLWS